MRQSLSKHQSRKQSGRLRPEAAIADQPGSGKHAATHGHATDKCGSSLSDTRGARSCSPHVPAAFSNCATSPVHIHTLYACVSACARVHTDMLKKQLRATVLILTTRQELWHFSSVLVHVHCVTRHPKHGSTDRSAEVQPGRAERLRPGPRVLTFHPGLPGGVPLPVLGPSSPGPSCALQSPLLSFLSHAVVTRGRADPTVCPVRPALAQHWPHMWPLLSPASKADR